MASDLIQQNGLLLLGCGKMGSALLAGWLKAGTPAEKVQVIEPFPSEWLQNTGAVLNQPIAGRPAVALLAVKPQMMQSALPQLQALGNSETVFISIAAGTTIASLEATLGSQTPIIRVMPNTPAMVGRGISGLIGNARVNPEQLALAIELMSAVGEVVILDNEDQIDAVTALSGSGPAYIFNLIEAMATAGEALGLSPQTALQLARATVCGSGELAYQSSESAAQLRINVTSPGGTTAAALEVLMDPKDGLTPLMTNAMKAAAERGRALSKI